MGVRVLHGDSETEGILRKLNAEAMVLDENMVLLGKKVTLSGVLEETFHIRQLRSGRNADKEKDIKIALNEIEAKEYLIKVAQKHKIPRRETELTKKQLESYKKHLQRLLDEGGG